MGTALRRSVSLKVQKREEPRRVRRVDRTWNSDQANRVLSSYITSEKATSTTQESFSQSNLFSKTTTPSTTHRTEQQVIDDEDSQYIERLHQFLKEAVVKERTPLGVVPSPEAQQRQPRYRYPPLGGQEPIQATPSSSTSPPPPPPPSHVCTHHTFLKMKCVCVFV
jgi:hypothetical protein